MEGYKGIDYGIGKSNINVSTGVRFGVISYNSISSEALNDIYYMGEDLSYKAYEEEFISDFRTAFEDMIHDFNSTHYCELEIDLTDIEDQIVNQIGEYYEQDENSLIRYEQDGYILETTSLGLYVLQSPYVTECKFCSPCCPGAGDLNNPVEGGVLAYALGEDWFDEYSPMPYKVKEVEV